MQVGYQDNKNSWAKCVEISNQSYKGINHNFKYLSKIIDEKVSSAK